jgi:hypothetical protein
MGIASHVWEKMHYFFRLGVLLLAGALVTYCVSYSLQAQTRRPASTTVFDDPSQGANSSYFLGRPPANRQLAAHVHG